MAPSMLNSSACEIAAHFDGKTMGLHDDTIAIAHERGYLTFSEVDLVRARAPAWFLRLACPQGVAEYQARSGVALPRALVDFYAATDLVCFLIASGQGAGIFDAQTCATDCHVRPPIEVLFGRKYVIVDEQQPQRCGESSPR